MKRPVTPEVIHMLLTDAVQELDSIKQRLERVAEMLIDARNHDVGLDTRSDDERRQDYGET